MEGAAVRADTKLELCVTAAALVLSIAYAAFVMAQAPFTSFYTLDDAYIHMALAENIARGHFGVNLGEVSNPSSSILWPWLMAAAEKLGVMLWAPLVINIASFVLSSRVLLSFSLARLAPNGANQLNTLLFVGLGFLSFNLFGVIFTGMEHSLHTLMSIVAVTRVIDRKYDRLTMFALVMLPLLRFEGVLLLAFGLGGALYDRRFVFAGVVFGAAALAVGLYQTWLASLGLPILPSSVLSKSSLSSALVDSGQANLSGLLENIGENLKSENVYMFGLLGLALAYAGVRRQGRDRLIALGMLGVLAVTFMLGIKAVSYARYAAYILCAAGAVAIHLFQEDLRKAMPRRLAALLLALALLVVNMDAGPRVLLTTPQAAHNIHRQHYQMHRFVAECWKKPIAVNDLGWVSLRNDSHVLDLAGLGSEEARKLRAAGDPDWMGKLVAERGVEAAMIYPEWFSDIPAGWTPVGDLLLQELKITPFGNVVRFYATTPEARKPIADCLHRLAPTLPRGASIQVFGDQ